MNTQKGFTIIELLVVIAVIGVLSSVILASIKSARMKNADAASKASLQGVPSQSELYYTDNGYSYINVCHLGSKGLTGAKSVGELVQSAAKSQDLSSYGENNVPPASLTTASCNNTDSAWAVEVPMKNKDLGGTGASAMFCIDSLGFVGYRTQSMGPTAVCPAS